MSYTQPIKRSRGTASCSPHGSPGNSEVARRPDGTDPRGDRRHDLDPRESGASKEQRPRQQSEVATRVVGRVLRVKIGERRVR